MSIIKTVRLVCNNIDNNNNKYWDAELHDNGQVFVSYGRIGKSKQSEGPFEGGEKFLAKKIKEKEKKGYKIFDGLAVTEGTSHTISVNSDVKEIAKKQITYSSPQLEKLIERLAAANVHNIVSNTQIAYNAKTGLFSTPLGIITPKMIADARSLLAGIKSKIVLDTTISKSDLVQHIQELNSNVQNYLMIVPHDLGMRKFTVTSLFPDQAAFDKELNILDSLEAAYTQFTSNTDNGSDKTEIKEEKIFDIELDVLNNKAEYERIVHWYESTKKQMHGYGNIKIQNIYTVDIKDMSKAFEEKGKKLGNIQEVWHGTGEANLLSILRSGLKVSPPSTAYIAGKAYGNGTYGALDSSKSLGYTMGRWGNNKGSSGWLFICQFAMGKTFEPTHERGNPPKGYDSTWAKAKKSGLYHDELIVFSNEQVKITHLLECK